MLNNPDMTPTRQTGLARLAAFSPHMGADYARLRNFDFGPDRRANVSALSPFIRHRLIAEEEVLRTTLSRHSPAKAEKFVQEVFWRSYFKGWLEMRPEIWKRYCNSVADGLSDLDKDHDLNARYTNAISGRTGIDCFDHWVGELMDRGWLHNHARMWFASIWIFTLRLPWALGADFFYRHLIDGDAASNTLSWRWVGGLHTRGKTYLARRSNIEKFSDGRFRPEGLAPYAEPLWEDDAPAPRPAPIAAAPGLAQRYGLIITEEDGLAETMPLPHPPSLIIKLGAARRSTLPTGSVADQFTAGALNDAADRATRQFNLDPAMEIAGDPAALNALGDMAEVTHFAMSRPAIGPLRDLVTASALPIVEILRPYDALTWPHAQKGFFALKKKIPKFLDTLDVTDQPRLL